MTGRSWHSWLIVAALAAAAFILIRFGLHASGLDSLFREQLPVGAPGRALVILAAVVPFAIALLASLLASAIARSLTAVMYAGSWPRVHKSSLSGPVEHVGRVSAHFAAHTAGGRNDEMASPGEVASATALHSRS